MSAGPHMLAQTLRERVPVDIGTSSLTAVRATAIPGRHVPNVAHPVYETLPLAAGECAALGSDFQRVGPLWPRPGRQEEELTDAYGVAWLEHEGNRAPFRHPLEQAEWGHLARHPRPALPEHVQLAQDTPALMTVLDAPCPGLLDTCFLLRNGWQFMTDLTEDFRVASALLDWALDTIEASYDAVLAALPEDPDVIIYGDDLGFESGMYLSDLDFRNFIFPRLQTLLTRLRRKSGALLCFHSCGAIRSICGDLAELGVDMMNLDFYAKNMILADVRKALPKDMILHGPVNLAAIGRAVENADGAALAILSEEVANAAPCIVAPIDSIGSYEDARHNFRGAAFVRALSTEDLRALRRYGPIKHVIDRAAAEASGCQMPELGLQEIRIGTMPRHAAAPDMRGRSGDRPRIV
ncbi:uroporphyrinogen decarboxylase family protein [Celeribacter indicus]|uniref:Methyltransferase CmuC n=1 Tax=Celeribacter indicus TaxID=1208324 RepID=A0A0B5E0C6_9RHOB|nr:uroporphyrinogen decarboxylase family protein [Celeribacter indicus]AJE48679.1 methyltransferase CmuC [Celeribacter indicus]SDX35580.1 Uroporphyrinogen decarboxylase (URO-D) [Celeribacter indicus]